MSSPETTEPQRYEIRSVADFFSVPDDRRAHCLADFRMWWEFVSDARRQFDGVPGLVIPNDKFTWIDDGKQDVHVQAEVVRRGGNE